MTHTHEHTLPSAHGKDLVIPAMLAALSVAAISLPIVTMKTMGFSGGIALPSPHLLGGTAYLLPLAFLISIGSRFAPQARPYRRMIEIAAFAVAAVTTLYVVVTLLNGLSEMNAANRQMSQMLGSAATRQFSLSSAVSLGSGCIALGLLVLGSLWQVRPGRR
ncbi:hypothetical protein [Agrobacterium cavarae]|uniref:hypothetical protein n=1 Tax=Agrobacterium cavarae TaxID=2528239 RepID=UPI003D0811C4